MSFGFSIESSYEKAHQKAVKEDKILMVYLTQKGCHRCRDELVKILQNKKLRLAIEKSALFVVVLKNQKESYPIEMLYTSEYPTLFFLDKRELFLCEALRGETKVDKILECLVPK